jgi:hypothetical protein
MHHHYCHHRHHCCRKYGHCVLAPPTLNTVAPYMGPPTEGQPLRKMHSSDYPHMSVSVPCAALLILPTLRYYDCAPEGQPTANARPPIGSDTDCYRVSP